MRLVLELKFYMKLQEDGMKMEENFILTQLNLG